MSQYPELYGKDDDELSAALDEAADAQAAAGDAPPAAKEQAQAQPDK